MRALGADAAAGCSAALGSAPTTTAAELESATATAVAPTMRRIMGRKATRRAWGDR